MARHTHACICEGKDRCKLGHIGAKRHLTHISDILRCQTHVYLHSHTWTKLNHTHTDTDIGFSTDRQTDVHHTTQASPSNVKIKTTAMDGSDLFDCISQVNKNTQDLFFLRIQNVHYLFYFVLFICNILTPKSVWLIFANKLFTLFVSREFILNWLNTGCTTSQDAMKPFDWLWF